jgi:hypothetical protein
LIGKSDQSVSNKSDIGFGKGTALEVAKHLVPSLWKSGPLGPRKYAWNLGFSPGGRCFLPPGTRFSGLFNLAAKTVPEFSFAISMIEVGHSQSVTSSSAATAFVLGMLWLFT